MICKTIKLLRIPTLTFAVTGPIDVLVPQDVINPEIKTAKSFERHKSVDNESGFDRIKRMFQLE